MPRRTALSALFAAAVTAVALLNPVGSVAASPAPKPAPAPLYPAVGAAPS